MVNDGFITQDESKQITYPTEFQWANITSESASTSFGQRYRSCALIDGLFGNNEPGESFFEIIPATLNVATLGLSCLITTGTADLIQGRYQIPIISNIIQVINMAVGTIVFLFQVIEFSITVLPTIVSILLFGPSGIALVIVATSIARGSGD